MHQEVERIDRSIDWEFLLELGVLIWCGKKLRLRKLEKEKKILLKDYVNEISSGFELVLLVVKIEVSF